MELAAFEPPAQPEVASSPTPPQPEAAMDRIHNIADVLLPIDAELDRKILSVRAIMSLSAGTVLKLSRSAGENIDIRIGDSLVGFGEIVILEDSTGVRITDFWGEA